MSVEEKIQILLAVECSPLPVTEALVHLDVPAKLLATMFEQFGDVGETGDPFYDSAY